MDGQTVLSDFGKWLCFSSSILTSLESPLLPKFYFITLLEFDSHCPRWISFSLKFMEMQSRDIHLATAGFLSSLSGLCDSSVSFGVSDVCFFLHCPVVFRCMDAPHFAQFSNWCLVTNVTVRGCYRAAVNVCGRLLWADPLISLTSNICLHNEDRL